MKKKPGDAAPTLGLAVNTLSFAVGAAAGFAVAVRLVEEGQISLPWLLPGCVQAMDAGRGAAGFLSLLWDTLRWPLLVWPLGFTALGTWAVPLLFGLRGFFLAFCTSGLAGALGDGGLTLAVILFGLGGLVPVSVFFALGVMSWTSARRVTGLFPGKQGSALYPPRFWLKTLIAFLALFLCALVEYFLFPLLLRGVLPYLT